MMEHEIRFTEMDDYPYLQKWLKDKEDSKYYPWNTENEFELSVKNWIGFSKYMCSLTVTVEGKPAGIATLYLMPYKKVAHHAMFYMIIGKEYQKKGLGASLLKNLENLARNYFALEFIHCEVLGPSPLISLLEKSKYHLIATQNDFVEIDGKPTFRKLFEKVLNG